MDEVGGGRSCCSQGSRGLREGVVAKVHGRRKCSANVLIICQLGISGLRVGVVKYLLRHIISAELGYGGPLICALFFDVLGKLPADAVVGAERLAAPSGVFIFFLAIAILLQLRSHVLPIHVLRFSPLNYQPFVTFVIMERGRAGVRYLFCPWRTRPWQIIIGVHPSHRHMSVACREAMLL